MKAAYYEQTGPAEHVIVVGDLPDGGVPGQSVLVAGGAGAVGHHAVQFAHLLGARQVITTLSSPVKAELARMAGGRGDRQAQRERRERLAVLP